MWHRRHNNESTQSEYRTQHNIILKTYIEKAKAKLSAGGSVTAIHEEEEVRSLAEISHFHSKVARVPNTVEPTDFFKDGKTSASIGIIGQEFKPS